MKRAITQLEEFHINRMVGMGCWITRGPAEYHHWLTGMNGFKVTRCHMFGAPFAAELHRLGSQSVHMMGDETKFCEFHNIDKQRSLDEAAISLELFVSGKPRLRLV